VSKDRGFSRTVFAVAVSFYAIAYLGLLSGADAALFLLTCSLIGQRLRPFLLLLAASVQDAPGLSYLWSYIGFAGIAGVMLMEATLRPLAATRAWAHRSAELLTVMAVALVAYGVCVSWLQASLGGYPQSGDRPFLLVGGLIVVMVLSGHFARLVLDSHARDRHLLGGVALLALGHALAIGLLQIPYGQEIYRSGTNLAQVEETRQLVEAGAIGFARINGPFLSPNTYGYTILLLATIVAVTLFDVARFRVLCLYVIAGAAAVLLSMSKAVLGYYGLTCTVLMSFVVGRARTMLLLVAAGMALPFILSVEYLELAFEVFRVQEDTLGTRQWAWSAVIQHLQPVDWIFGVGLGTWPLFFGRYVGVPLSDPHSVLLSVPSTYGVLGVLFYGLLLRTLLRPGFADRADPSMRVGRSFLVLLFVVKDLASIPSVLGNTPVTFLVWLVLGLVLHRSQSADGEAAGWPTHGRRTGVTAAQAGRVGSPSLPEPS
jgi:hypothetical protein